MTCQASTSSRHSTRATAADGRSPPAASADDHPISPEIAPPPIRLIPKTELLKRVPLSFPTIWKMMQENRFPRARVIGGKSVWIESEIDDFLAALPLRRYKTDRCLTAATKK
jgi:predicted DNA-binding transcriptional regulator AlpA